jgi:SAM-dependent methyltransferase
MRQNAIDGRPPGGQTLDWGVGCYERIAESLAPAAHAVVRAAAVVPGEAVLDVGCGTGTVAMLAAAKGARVTAVDPAGRLLDVARGEAEREGLDIAFLPGEAASLPTPDAAFDAVLSNFAVIFAPDPRAAVTEMVRVLAADGRIVFSAWLPGGTVGTLNATATELVRAAVGSPATPPGFPWHDADALGPLLAEHRLRLTLEQHEMAFVGTSPADFLEDQRTSHPLSAAGFAALERVGRGDSARAELLRILVEGNEDPPAFRATARYVVARAGRR